MLRKFIHWAVSYPKRVVAITVFMVILAVVQFPRIRVDTDPENMLPADAPVRVFDHAMKKEFAIYDFIVLGIVNDKDPGGVFNPKTLGKVFRITEDIMGLKGVIASEIIAPSTKDNIEQGDLGSVRFNWLMEAPPRTQEEAVRILREAEDHPMFRGSVVSEDGRALALYIPLEHKTLSFEVSQKIQQIITKYAGDEKFFITGLPVAEDQFGVEMFKQMAISAPLAGLVIFFLMWWFFRSVLLITAPMLLAVATVLLTMGLLIGLGFPVHIMSSMIPIFLMPIAVLDSVHILSEFFDKYRLYGNKEKAVAAIFEELFTPMLYTSLTSIAGFFSLSFAPIPPVQVFGIFVALGVAIAWVLTMTFIPAFIMLLNEEQLKNFGAAGHEEKETFLDKALLALRAIVLKRAKVVVGVTVVIVALSIYGIAHIRVNDNPVRWFTKGHPLRVADRVLNDHFAGTYPAYLVFEAEDKNSEVFITPEMLTYIEKLEQGLLTNGLAGKTTSLVAIVKKIYDELLGGDKKNSVIPPTKEAVAQCLISFESSHKPDDLWHLTTPDYSKLNVWLQLKSGDNKDMSRVAQFVERYLKENPPPYRVSHHWAGLTYINMVWQDEMVVGMLKNFMGSFVIVFHYCPVIK